MLKTLSGVLVASILVKLYTLIASLSRLELDHLYKFLSTGHSINFTKNEIPGVNRHLSREGNSVSNNLPPYGGEVTRGSHGRFLNAKNRNCICADSIDLHR